MWDGDKVIATLLASTGSPVLSPLGGMVTVARFLLLPFVLVGQGSKPTGWDGDKLSFWNKLFCILRFEPTVWDGDKSMKPFEVMKRYFSCSKPTGWDGD